jgi:hypothetical protein
VSTDVDFSTNQQHETAYTSDEQSQEVRFIMDHYNIARFIGDRKLIVQKLITLHPQNEQLIFTYIYRCSH